MARQIHKNFNIADYTYTNVFVETGTGYGMTSQKALDGGFKYVRSVELHDPIYQFCLEKFKDNEQIKLWHGRSYEKLPEMISDINEPVTFFLDAHPSGPNTAGHDELVASNHSDTSEAHQHNIIKKELKVISEHPIKNHTILIDDQHGLHMQNLEYKKFLLENVNSEYKFYFISDRDCVDQILLCTTEKIILI